MGCGFTAATHSSLTCTSSKIRRAKSFHCSGLAASRAADRSASKAAGHLEQALALTEACAAPYERALTLLALAELRAATGDRDAARTLLGQVRAICESLGAKPALARADALAARLDEGGP